MKILIEITFLGVSIATFYALCDTLDDCYINLVEKYYLTQNYYYNIIFKIYSVLLMIIFILTTYFVFYQLNLFYDYLIYRL